MIWDEVRTARLLEMRAKGESYSAMAKALHVRKGAVAGKLARLDGRALPQRRCKPRKPAAVRRAEPNRWDDRLFEPWAEYTARKKLERANANP